MKKVFLITQFGQPHDWTQKYIDNVQRLGEFGWEWKIFTPNHFVSKGNVEIVPMTIDQFADLTLKYCGIKPAIRITEDGIPSFHITDFYIFMGQIMQDFTKGYDFWGMTGLDNVYGRLEYFIPDSLLTDCAIYSDDNYRIGIGTLNGNFSLWRNNRITNELYKRIPEWKEILSQPDCPGCLGTGAHKLYAPEDFATEVLTAGIKFKFPKWYDVHGHDHLANHKLSLKPDGSLWEVNPDVRGMKPFAREIAYYHFSGRKEWPNL